jgi:hypothetical protein
MNVNKNRILFFGVFMLLVEASCIGPKKKVASPPDEQAIQNDEGKLLFINLLFSKTPEGKDSCSVMNSIVTDGVLREQENSLVRNKDNYYTLFFNSCAGKTLYKEEIDNQLDTQMEVYNENGPIELKNISFKQREYSIRMQKGKEKICRLIVTRTAKGQTETICNHLINL